jgi:tetratricopeptide (TPR) repeat protein
MARIALLIADELDPGMPHVASNRLRRDFQARCHANLGNVHRVLCQWKEAESHLKEAFELLWQGIGDPAVHAEIQSLRGSFLNDRQDFEAAIAAMQESATLYQELCETHQAGVALLQVASAYCLKGEPNLALPIHLRGIEMVDEEVQPVVAAAAWNNLVRIYLDLGKFEEAASTLRAAPNFIDVCPPDSSVHPDLAWTEGCVFAGLDRFHEALISFQEALKGFLSRHDPYNAALVQLDRLRVLLKQGRLREVEELAHLVVEMLRAEPLEREAEEVLRLLLVAASRRQLLESLVEKTALTLRLHPKPPRIR